MLFSSGSIFIITVLFASVISSAFGIGPPSPTPISGERSSLDESVKLAENTGFTIKLPVETPLDLLLTDIRLSGVRPLDLQRPWIEGVSEVRLIFSNKAVAENMTLPDLLGYGGMLVIEMKKDPRDVQIIDSLIEAGGRNGFTSVVKVDGKLGYYEEASEDLPWRTMLFWIDGETRLEMLANPEHFSQDNLISFAESFTDWSAIKTSTTTTTVTIFSTIQTVSTVTKTTTVSQLQTLTETVTKETAETSTESIESTIYAWAVGATIATVLLAVVIISQRRIR